jgi:hypothetical protein
MVDPADRVRDGTAARLRVDLSERRHDLRHDVPVPFASDPFAGFGSDHRLPATGPVDLGGVVKARAIQCALSRVCGLCGLSLATGPAAATTFLGSVAEADANTFVFPPVHMDCAELALDTYPALGVPVLGQRLVLAEWAVVVTGGFELERPAERGAPVLFHPNSVSSRATVTPG